VNETARTVAKEILKPNIDCIASLKVLNGIFGNGRCTRGVADADGTRQNQIKNQTRIQCWHTRDVTIEANRKVDLKKQVKLLYKSVHSSSKHILLIFLCYSQSYLPIIGEKCV